MAKTPDYIPASDKDFFDWQDNLVTIVTPKVVAWNIDPPDFTVVTAEQLIYVPLYNKIKNKNNRTGTDVNKHRDERVIYEKILRDFTQANLANNKKVSNGDRTLMNITVKDTTQTSRPKITVTPIVKPTSKAGAIIEIVTRVDNDSTRPSIHVDSDGVEVVYIVATSAPVDPDACTKTFFSSKAKFRLAMKIADAGKKIYGFCRWKNSSDESKSGPWSLMFSATITE